MVPEEVERLHAAAKLFEEIGAEAYDNVASTIGYEIADALIVSFLRRKMKRGKALRDHLKLIESVNAILMEKGLLREENHDSRRSAKIP